MPSLQGCMPCIFVILMVTSTSMQTRVLIVADFRDLVFSCCYFYAMCSCCFREIYAFFEHDQSGCFEHMDFLYPSMLLFVIMECHSLSQSSSTFAIKCYWQIVYMLFDFAKLVVVDPCMI